MATELSGRIILVTGASRGIGRASAIALAAAGASTICTGRDVEALENTVSYIARDGGVATPLPLDMEDFTGLDRLGATVLERWGRLDGYLANAGILGTFAPLAKLGIQIFSDLVDINITANWRLIRSLDPVLRRSDAGRALFITSGAARKHTAMRGGYAMSKAALESLALTYAAECEGGAIKANLLNPGPLRTDMRAQAVPEEDPSRLKRPEDMAPLVVELLSPSNMRNGTLLNFQN